MTVGAHLYASLSTVFGLITVGALVAILIVKEALRIRGAPKGDSRTRALTIVTLPLMAVFAVLLVVRVLIFLE